MFRRKFVVLFVCFATKDATAWTTFPARSTNVRAVQVNQQKQSTDEIDEADLSANSRRKLLVKSSIGLALSFGLDLGNIQAAGAIGGGLDSSELRRIDIFEKVAPSVVFIDTFTERRDVFTTNVMEVPLGTGSGFVWDDDGHIITNYHVIRDSKAS